MDRWDIIIIAGAGYVAVMTLVRLMVARRNFLVDQVKHQIEEQQELHRQKQQKASENADRGAA